MKKFLIMFLVCSITIIMTVIPASAAIVELFRNNSQNSKLETNTSIANLKDKPWGVLQNWNDTISGLRINNSKGIFYRVTLYRDVNYTGISRSYTVTNLYLSQKIKNEASSIKLEQKQPDGSYTQIGN